MNRLNPVMAKDLLRWYEVRRDNLNYGVPMRPMDRPDQQRNCGIPSGASDVPRERNGGI
ncbi:MAG: hypothetical protein ABIJ44_06890 [Pseudomonadota bacterium]